MASDSTPKRFSLDELATLAGLTPRTVRPGSVEVWSRVTLADGLEVNLEPGRAGLSAEQVRALVRRITEAYREVRTTKKDDA